MKSKKLLVIDNYDSFTYNLVQMFKRYVWLDIEVFRNDKVTIKQIKKRDPYYILISPGPKFPSAAGISMEVIDLFCGKRSILGVCLGMQCINEYFGGITKKAPLPIHGKAYQIEHNGEYLFTEIPSPFLGTRYHSLCVKLSKDSPLNIDAVCPRDRVIMAVSIPEQMIFGVQFHPESFLTQYGDRLIDNFLGF